MTSECERRLVKWLSFPVKIFAGDVVILLDVFLPTAANFLNFIINKTGGLLLLSVTPLLPQVMHMICSSVPDFQPNYPSHRGWRTAMQM